MPHTFRAAWVLPIVSPPIPDGWVAVDGGRVHSVGSGESPLGPTVTDADGRSKRIAILPGLVNAHTHLELSWMEGLVPPAEAMPSWAQRLIALRQSADPAGETARQARIAGAIRHVHATGTILAGDVTNTLDTCAPLASSPLAARVFFELLGFRSADPAGVVAQAEERIEKVTQTDRVRPVVAAHAPYSVSPALFRAIGRATGDRPFSVHLGESQEEVQFLRDGSGAWRALLERIGAWAPDWQPPACGPVEYLDRLGLLNARLIAVHGVQLTDGELERLAEAGATLVTCPRSNRWTAAGTPPIARFYASGVRVAIGTDSLASADDLNLFSEMAAMRAIAPGIPARDILHSATVEGARALGFDGEFGSLAPGTRAELLAVEIPDGVADVEEYLVSGIQPPAVAWLHAGSVTPIPS